MNKTIKRLLLGALIAGIAAAGLYTAWHLVIPKTQTTVQPYAGGQDETWIRSFFKENWYWLISEYSIDFSLDPILAHLTYQNKPLTIDMLYIHKKPAGFVATYQETPTMGKILFLGIDKRFRGHGYATLLIQKALARLCAQGSSYVDLITRTQNLSAQTTYTRNKFYEINRTQEGFVQYRYTCAR